MYQRKQYNTLYSRMREKRRFIQVIMGPRQVGKSTLMKQVVNALDIPFVFYPADAVPATQLSWISDCWNAARAKMRVEGLGELILVIDEIQKITGWSEVVKKEWDTDTFYDVNLKVILLGSSRVMLDKGLADSLAGRFERIILSHWSFAEMRDAFGFTLDQFIYYGAYPGAAELIGDEDRWRDYITGSIVDAEMMQLPSECNTKSCANLIKPNHQGICPNGWRLLTEDDFYVVLHADGNKHGAEDVRATSFGGLNFSGYSLIGTGYNWAYVFKNEKEATQWFYPRESVEYPEEGAPISSMNDADKNAASRDLYKTYGSSVRCVMVK